MVFVVRPNKLKIAAQGLFKVGSGAGPHADMPSIHKNASDPVGITLKKGVSGARR